MQYDYIIVGQGIAGTMLAHFLIKKNKKVLVIDKYTKNSSTNIAAGIVNPITGMRLVKSWMIDEILPFAKNTYGELEKLFDTSFYIHKKMIFLINSVKEMNDWLAKSDSMELKNHVGKCNDIEAYQPYLNKYLGCFEITQSAVIDLPEVIKKYRDYFLDQNWIMGEKFDISELQIQNNKIFYKENESSKIIFCEGDSAIDNPFFNYLPFQLTKGEILTVRIQDFPQEKIINKGVFILPIGNNLFKVGSNYEWKYNDKYPSENGKTEIEKKLQKVISCKYEIINHQAGIRPTVVDRRPFIGLHPKYLNIGIFNGMGSKGSYLAPYFANHFVEYLEGNISLNKEVDIKRFAEN